MVQSKRDAETEMFLVIFKGMVDETINRLKTSCPGLWKEMWEQDHGR